MKEISVAELEQLIDTNLHTALRIQWERNPTAVAYVLFENITLDSSQCGRRTAVVVGPDQTFKSVEACQGKWINDLPSERQHAQSFCRPPRPWV